MGWIETSPAYLLELIILPLLTSFACIAYRRWEKGGIMGKGDSLHGGIEFVVVGRGTMTWDCGAVEMGERGWVARKKTWVK